MSIFSVTNQGAVVVIDQGMVSHRDYTCTLNSAQSKIKIIKEEGHNLSYKVAVIYQGIVNNHPRWSLKINDKAPTNGFSTMTYAGSRVFAFRPVNSEVIEIQETDDNGTQSIWLKPLEEVCKYYMAFPLETKKVQSLVEKGKLFQPADGKKVKKIFYDLGVGVLLYARDASWNTSIYFGKETGEFVPCESTKTHQCQCSVADSEWNVKIPGEDKIHKFVFSQGLIHEDEHGSRASWDSSFLSTIEL